MTMKMTHSDTFHCSPQQLWPWIDDDEKSKQWLKGLEEVRPVTSGRQALQAGRHHPRSRHACRAGRSAPSVVSPPCPG